MNSKEWKELRAIVEAELKDRKEKEDELVRCGHTSHISAYPFINRQPTNE